MAEKKKKDPNGATQREVRCGVSRTGWSPISVPYWVCKTQWLVASVKGKKNPSSAEIKTKNKRDQARQVGTGAKTTAALQQQGALVKPSQPEQEGKGGPAIQGMEKKIAAKKHPPYELTKKLQFFNRDRNTGEDTVD